MFAATVDNVGLVTGLLYAIAFIWLVIAIVLAIVLLIHGAYDQFKTFGGPATFAVTLTFSAAVLTSTFAWLAYSLITP